MWPQKIRKILALIALPFALGGWNGGYTPGYEPFANPVVFPVSECIPSETANNTYSCLQGKSTITFTSTDESGTLKINHYSTTYTYTLKDYYGEMSEVYSHDFNEDKIPDLAIVIGRMGTGLASEYCRIVFLLSTGKTFKFASMSSMGFNQKHFIVLNQKLRIVRTSFIYGMPGKDQKTHNYWVHQFLKINGTNLSIDKKLKYKWIMYTFNTNHTETRQLTEQQKSQLWQKEYDIIDAE